MWNLPFCAYSKLFILSSWIFQDVALASVSMRPIPFSPVLEKLPLSNIKYGSIRRFYVETTEDNAIPIALQQSMINQNPPERVFQLKGADHSPFFSKPQALHKILVEISRIPPIWSYFSESFYEAILKCSKTDALSPIQGKKRRKIQVLSTLQLYQRCRVTPHVYVQLIQLIYSV